MINNQTNIEHLCCDGVRPGCFWDSGFFFFFFFFFLVFCVFLFLPCFFLFLLSFLSLSISFFLFFFFFVLGSRWTNTIEVMGDNPLLWLLPVSHKVYCYH